MFNELEDILRDLSQGLFLLSIPVNILYFSLTKLDKKLDQKLGEKNDQGRNFIHLFFIGLGDDPSSWNSKGEEITKVNK